MKPRSADDPYRALADPTRRAVLEQLKAGEQSVGTLAQQFEMSLPAFSRHLKVLHDAGLVNQRSQGTQRLYTLNPEPLKDMSEWLHEFEGFWNQKLDALAQYLNSTKGKRKGGK
jgi:DNA-binding transcriptional ArsR family regulator